MVLQLFGLYWYSNSFETKMSKNSPTSSGWTKPIVTFLRMLMFMLVITVLFLAIVLCIRSIGKSFFQSDSFTFAMFEIWGLAFEIYGLFGYILFQFQQKKLKIYFKRFRHINNCMDNKVHLSMADASTLSFLIISCAINHFRAVRYQMISISSHEVSVEEVIHLITLIIFITTFTLCTVMIIIFMVSIKLFCLLIEVNLYHEILVILDAQRQKKLPHHKDSFLTPMNTKPLEGFCEPDFETGFQRKFLMEESLKRIEGTFDKNNHLIQLYLDIFSSHLLTQIIVLTVFLVIGSYSHCTKMFGPEKFPILDVTAGVYALLALLVLHYYADVYNNTVRVYSPWRTDETL